ncbi:PD40 domain-containing protein, partial [bacterium]|nr:PD40 domain-containing protein [bacterium]
IPPLPPDKPIHLDVNSQKGYDNDDTLTFYWLYPSVNKLDGTESVHYIERPAKYNVYFTTLEGETQNAELKNQSEFLLAGTTDKSSYSFEVESGKIYRIAVEAVDEVGNASELSEFSESIFVDSHTPKVLIHFPKPSTSIFGSTPVIVTCFDDNLVEWRLQYKFTTKAAISWGEKEGSEWKPLAYSNESIEHQRVAFWDVSKLQGVYTLELIAIDEAGNQSKADIPVVVDNTPPIPITSGDIGTELVISDLDSDYQSPAWSPDGSMIAYASNEGGAYDIWIFDLKTRTKNRLTRDTAFDVNPVWSPDSRWLAFQSLRFAQGRLFGNGNWDIEVISIDGSQRLPIVGDEDGFTGVNHVDSDLTDVVMDTTPAWSSDGDHLAFSSNVDGDGEIWLITNINEVLQGGQPNLTQLTQNEWEDSHPTWSPDGTKIAFQSNRHGNWDIWAINIDGSQEEQLTSDVDNEVKPKWSPDGKRILFVSDQSAEVQGQILALEIHREGEAPAEPEIISLSPWSAEVSASASHADWSPDLKSMVYQAGNNIYLTDFDFPPPQIEAIITRPYQGEYIGAEKSQNTSEFWVDIIGLARGINFQEYRLEYALNDDSPAKLNWIRIGGISTSQVTQIGFLGRLDTRKLQGEYILRLSVFGKNGDRALDSVSIFVEHERPRLVVAGPPDGLITDKPLIVVSGETEANVQITINDEWVKLEPTSLRFAQGQAKTARFDTSLLLEEGDNIITIVARHTEFGIQNSEFRLGTTVQRRVFLAREKMTINVDAPKDFEVVNVPYVTVKGSVGQIAKVVKIQQIIVIGSEVQPQQLMSLDQDEPKADLSQERSERENVDEQSEKLKTFQRIVLLDEGVNLISIEVTDQLNRLIRIQRHVIYEKLTVIGRDINPPAITNIMPPDGTAVADARPEISAILLDDVKIAPETIAFIFDGKGIDRKNLRFNEEDGSFSYTIEESFLGDGEHNFTMSVQDTSGNPGQISVKFFIDTEPLEIAISAQVDTDNSSRLKVILSSNKPLQSIPMAALIPIGIRNSELGYSINLNRVVPDVEDGKVQPFRSEGFFDATPLQNSFTLNALVTDNFGRTHTVYGYYSSGSISESIATLLWGQMKFGSESTRLKSEMGVTEANRLGISGIIEAIFPMTILEPVHSIVLRSQDGLDLDRLTAQRQNAEDRGLELINIVHVVEADQKREEMTFILRLPIPKANNPLTPFDKGDDQLKENFAFFHWDARLQRWEAMDAIRNFSEGWIQATVNKFGAYAL